MKKQSYFKKFAAVAMAAVMTFAFTACGSDDAAQKTAVRMRTRSSSSAVSDLRPGGAAVYGQAVKNAAEMAAEEINAARRHQRLSG